MAHRERDRNQGEIRGLTTMAPSDLRDSDEHLIEHTRLQEQIRTLRDSVKSKLSDLEEDTREILETLRETRDRTMKIEANLAYGASKEDLSTAITTCKAEHPGQQKIDWKSLTALVVAVIMASSGLAVAIIKAL